MVNRDLKNLCQSYAMILNAFFLPIFIILLLGKISESSYNILLSSYDYYAVTILLYAGFSSSMMASGNYLDFDVKRANFRILSTSVKRHYIYISKIISSFVFTGVSHTLIIIILFYIFKINYGGSNMIFVILVQLMLEFASVSLGILLCCILTDVDKVNQILSMLGILLSLFGGLFFQIESFGVVFRFLSNLSPLKWIMISDMQVIYDGNFQIFWWSVGGLFLLGFICTCLCHKFFKVEGMI